MMEIQRVGRCFQLARNARNKKTTVLLYDVEIVLKIDFSSQSVSEFYFE